MRSLAENWDGYGAAAPATTAIELGQEFVSLLEAMLKKSSSEPSAVYVTPTRIGGVLIEWEDRAAQHEVEISSDRSIAFLHFDKATGQIETRTYRPSIVVDYASFTISHSFRLTPNSQSA